MTLYKLFFLVASIFVIAAGTSVAQEQDSITKNDSLRKDALNVYFNCPVCDMDYIKKEITFINYVRDQKDAQLYILVTSMYTGSGGEEYSIYFIGQKEFSGKNDTLIFTSSPDDTDDKIRSMGNQMLKLGLISYVAKTPLGKDISIDYGTYEETNPENVEDPWKSWVFTINGNGYTNGEESYKYYNLYSYVNANKVTEKNRFEITTNYSMRQSKFKIDDTTWIVSSTNSKSLHGLYVGSLGDHWSFGGSLSAYTSTYNNIKFGAAFYSTIEYNIFKYAESTRRQLRFKYSIGVEDNNYIDTTIFDKTKETLAAHNLDISYKVIEKWGSIYFYFTLWIELSARFLKK